jgi:surface protein
MAIQSASAKLYLGIKLMCVDKNAQATLISSFTVGNIDKDFPNDVPDVDVNSNFTFNGVNNVKIYSGIYPWKIKRAVADLVVTPQLALVQERYKTYGFGNNVITEGSPRVIDNTNNWKVTSSLVCEFPTYIEIDVGKLQLPEGTTVTLNFEEGWIVEDRGNLLASGGYEYPNAVQGAPSPRKDNYITFRTPWYGLSFMNSQFSVPNTVLRIKQLQASILSEGSITRAYPIYNPGNFAALFGGVFLTTPNASKKVVTGSVMSSVFGPAIFNFPYRLRLFQSDFAPATFTQPDTNGTRVRFASSTMESLFAMNASPVKDVSINLTAFNNVAMTTTAVKKVSPVQVLNVISSIVASQEITRRASSNISSLFGTTANVSYRVSPVVPQFAVISTMVPSFDTIMEYNTAVYTTTYTGYGSQQRYIAFAINGRSTPLTILWGDGSQDTYGTADGYVTHTYASNGIYNIRIRGRFTHLGETDEQASVDGSNPSGLAFRLQGYNSKSQITKVKAFGEHGLTNLNYAFGSCVKLTTVPATMVDANITTMKYCFGECRLFNSNISAWPVNLSGEFALWNTFSRCQSFNQPLNNWDISNVTGLYATFANSGFNQPLNNWDTRNVTTMYFLFYNTGFNQNISSWNTSQVNNMNSMFGNNGSFDQNISNWCVTLIPTKPSGFDQFTNANWTTAEKPVWGTCP